MRRRLNIERARDTALSEPPGEAVGVVIGHVSSVERTPKKENPAVGTPGSDFVVIGVYGFKYAAWLPFIRSRAVNRFCFSCTAYVFFFFFYFLVLRLRSKFNRSLCDFASISVGLRTHSSLGRDGLEKQDACHERICFSNHRASRPSSLTASSLDTLL
jgi:hypothetical protein